MDTPKVSSMIDLMFPDSFLTIFIDNLILKGYGPDTDNVENIKAEFEILKNEMRKVLEEDENLNNLWENTKNQIAISRMISKLLTTHLQHSVINTTEPFYSTIFHHAISNFLYAYPEYIRVNSITLVKKEN